MLTIYPSQSAEPDDRRRRTIKRRTRRGRARMGNRPTKFSRVGSARPITRVYWNSVRLARLIYRPVYAAEYGPGIYCRGDMLMQRDSRPAYPAHDYRRGSRPSIARFPPIPASYARPLRYRAPFSRGRADRRGLSRVLELHARRGDLL